MITVGTGTYSQNSRVRVVVDYVDMVKITKCNLKSEYGTYQYLQFENCKPTLSVGLRRHGVRAVVEPVFIRCGDYNNNHI